jgi:hypothetical protein
MMSISMNFLIQSEWLFLNTKICPFLKQDKVEDTKGVIISR